MRCLFSGIFTHASIHDLYTCNGFILFFVHMTTISVFYPHYFVCLNRLKSQNRNNTENDTEPLKMKQNEYVLTETNENEKLSAKEDTAMKQLTKEYTPK